MSPAGTGASSSGNWNEHRPHCMYGGKYRFDQWTELRNSCCSALKALARRGNSSARWVLEMKGSYCKILLCRLNCSIPNVSRCNGYQKSIQLYYQIVYQAGFSFLFKAWSREGLPVPDGPWSRKQGIESRRNALWRESIWRPWVACSQVLPLKSWSGCFPGHRGWLLASAWRLLWCGLS